MKTSDVKCNKSYLYKGEVVTVMKRIPGEETKKPIMQSGVMFTGYERTRKMFLLSNGETVYSKDLTAIS